MPRIARLDGERAYRDLIPYRIAIALVADDCTFKAAGPGVVTSALSSTGHWRYYRRHKSPPTGLKMPHGSTDYN